MFCIDLAAQDSIQKLKIPTLNNRTVNTARPKILPLTFEQQVAQKINRFLDSMVQTNDAHPFFIGKVKTGISNILYQFWKNRSLAGTKSEEAFYVQCNSQTMTQKDIADGRLVVVIGYARLKPAEFTTERFERILLNKTPLQYAISFSSYSKSSYNKYFLRISLNLLNAGSQLLRISASLIPSLICLRSVLLPASLLKK